LQLDIPRESTIDVEVTLDLNLGGGAYMLDASVWQYHDQRTVVNGPVVLVQVADEFTQVGQVYLNPRAHVVTPSTAVVAS
jgi:hypothetical protein